MDRYSKDVRAWRQAAEVTYSGARQLFASDNAVVWFPAAILGHHALELQLKAALVRSGRVVERNDVWGHVLVDLAKNLAEHCAGFPVEIMEGLAVFDAYFEELRYPHSLNRVEGLGQEEGLLLGRLMSAVRTFSD